MSVLQSPWTFSVTYIEMMYGGRSLASGSAFFWNKNERIFLVSNWHNFAGRNPLTGQPLNANGGIPDHVTFLLYETVSQPDERGDFEMKISPKTVSICDTDLSNSRWLQHPTLGSIADVGAIDVTENLKNAHFNCVNVVEADAIIDPFVSQDIFIVGYPLGIIDGLPSPVWKRGTIASEPTFDPEGHPKIYIDSATRKGMSGSIVLARHMIIGKSIQKKDGSMSEPLLFAIRDTVLGIYSGRLGAHEIQAQLGIVWKRNVIEETISGGCYAKTL